MSEQYWMITLVELSRRDVPRTSMIAIDQHPSDYIVDHMFMIADDADWRPKHILFALEITKEQYEEWQLHSGRSEFDMEIKA